MIFSLTFLSSTGWTQIVEHFELVRDAEGVLWTDLAGQPTILDMANADGVEVTHSDRVKGMFDRRRGAVYSEAYGRTPTLDVQTLMPENGKERGSRAVWQNRLPFAKLVQAEVRYEVLLDATDREPPVTFSLIVEEQGARKEKGWRTVATFDAKSIESRFHATVSGPMNAGEERFINGTFIADLTPWAGRYVRLVFEARFRPGTPGLMRARWLQGRLVSSDFRATLLETDELPDEGAAMKTRAATKVSDVSGTVDGSNPPPGASFSLEASTGQPVYGNPDTGLTIENFDGRQVAYAGTAIHNGTAHLGSPFVTSCGRVE